MAKKTKIRKFESGAIRDTSKGKFEYARFLSPKVLKRFGKYMDFHRRQTDGKIREPDNWKKGMTKQSFIDSMFRHIMDVWLIHETGKSIRPENNKEIDIEDALCGVMFNSMGYLYETLKEK